MIREITGRHVFFGFVGAFGVIIAVNVILAINAVRTFPGLEVKNSYVASQQFDARRAAQEALGWDVAAWVEDGELFLTFADAEGPVEPIIEKAIFGHATTVQGDQSPDWTFDGTAFRAPVVARPGNWNLRIEARADDETLFQQRIVILVDGQ